MHYHQINNPLERPFHYSLCKPLLEQSPAHAAHAIREGKDPTPDMALGNLFHTLLLEPHELAKRFALEPHENGKTIRRNTIKYKQWYAQNISLGLQPYSIQDLKKCEAMIKSLRSNEHIAPLFKSMGIAEMVINWVDRWTGIPCAASIDWWRGMPVDLKKSRDASPEGFGKSIANYHYDIQAAFYCDGLKAASYPVPEIDDIPVFVWICCEDEPPYASALYYAQPEHFEAGREKYRHCLNVWKRCLESEAFLGYTSNKPIMPRLYKRKLIEGEYYG